MTFSFNKAFKEKHEVPKEIIEKCEKCSKCEHLKYTVDNHHWVYRCTKTDCEFA